MPAALPLWSGRVARVSGSNRVGKAEGGMGLPSFETAIVICPSRPAASMATRPDP